MKNRFLFSELTSSRAFPVLFALLGAHVNNLFDDFLLCRSRAGFASKLKTFCNEICKGK